ncbi:MAG: hypothetical protein M0Z54_11765 [Thermaerobacter sp.]|nr:hypothetical protein [Thermaerobacter sp.]
MTPEAALAIQHAPTRLTIQESPDILKQGWSWVDRRDRLNITVVLPRNLVTQLRHHAVDEGLSLSAYAAAILDRAAEATDRTDYYEAARARQVALMHHGLSLGFDRALSSRDQLHER